MMSSASGSKKGKAKIKKSSICKKVKMSESENSGGNGGTVTDPIYENAKASVKATIAWMKETNAKPGGLLAFFMSTPFERSPPEKHKTYAFNANRERNRNPDFPLYDHSRVRLKIEAESDNNYINASHVAFSNLEKQWIVSQHPMKDYFEDFWKMVFYHEIDCIYAIFSPTEDLPTYFPTEKGKFFNHGQFFVHCWKLQKPTNKYDPTNYTIEVLPSGCSNARYTTLLHYPHWPKGFVAPSPKVVLKGIQLTETSDSMPQKPRKCLVHSAEGINRAMNFVMVDFIVATIFRNIPLDITELVTQLRSQRGGAFQNRMFCLYALYVFTEYVKIRLDQKSKISEADTLQDILQLQKSMKAEFSEIIARETKLQSSFNKATDKSGSRKK